jgi:hypothetical protein
MIDFTDPTELYNEFLRAKGALTRYIQRAKNDKNLSDWRTFRTLQVRYNSLHKEVYGR